MDSASEMVGTAGAGKLFPQRFALTCDQISTHIARRESECMAFINECLHLCRVRMCLGVCSVRTCALPWHLHTGWIRWMMDYVVCLPFVQNVETCTCMIDFVFCVDMLVSFLGLLT